MNQTEGFSMTKTSKTRPESSYNLQATTFMDDNLGLDRTDNQIMTVILNKKGDLEYEIDPVEKTMQRPSTAALVRIAKRDDKLLVQPNLKRNIMMDSKSTLHKSSNSQSYTNIQRVKMS